MTKKERGNIDTIIEGLDTQKLTECNIAISRLAREYRNTKALSAAQADSFEIVCHQIEKAIADINKFVDYLALYGAK